MHAESQTFIMFVALAGFDNRSFPEKKGRASRAWALAGLGSPSSGERRIVVKQARTRLAQRPIDVARSTSSLSGWRASLLSVRCSRQRLFQPWRKFTQPPSDPTLDLLILLGLAINRQVDAQRRRGHVGHRVRQPPRQ